MPTKLLFNEEKDILKGHESYSIAYSDASYIKNKKNVSIAIYSPSSDTIILGRRKTNGFVNTNDIELFGIFKAICLFNPCSEMNLNNKRKIIIYTDSSAAIRYLKAANDYIFLNKEISNKTKKCSSFNISTDIIKYITEKTNFNCIKIIKIPRTSSGIKYVDKLTKTAHSQSFPLVIKNKNSTTNINTDFDLESFYFSNNGRLSYKEK